jgi:serine/threonine-protein phosphatase 2A activator
LPEKKIKSQDDMAAWERSETHFDLIGFINTICMAVQGKRLSSPCELTDVAKGVLNILAKFEQLAVETPPIDQPQRFGNMAFRSWYKKMSESALPLLQENLPEEYHRAAPELAPYLTESFGNATRIDYGTGHELSFVLFLIGLYKIGALTKVDEQAIGLKIFDTYLNFARKLQVTYRMEPAGSHGVWSLDDYQFIPFIWGSAQLAANSPIDPEKFVEETVVENYRKEYMFIGCIDYIRQVKTGQFAEHSNQLWSISAVPSWSKICTGLIKMYQKEVISKFPVIQHVLFGSLLNLNPVKPGMRLMPLRLGMMVPPSTRVVPPPLETSVPKP